MQLSIAENLNSILHQRSLPHSALTFCSGIRDMKVYRKNVHATPPLPLSCPLSSPFFLLTIERKVWDGLWKEGECQLSVSLWCQNQWEPSNSHVLRERETDRDSEREKENNERKSCYMSKLSQGRLIFREKLSLALFLSLSWSLYVVFLVEPHIYNLARILMRQILWNVTND